MSNVQTITDAILTTADAAWQDGPVVWPGEVFNPDAPAGRFATFSPGCDFSAVEIRFDSAGRETHGTAGIRVRVGEVSIWIYTANGEGPGRALEIGDTFAAAFRDARLLSNEVQFHDPLVEPLGEGDDQRFVALVRCPFTAWSTSP